MTDQIIFPVAAIAALARGQRIEAIKLVREGNGGLDLRRAMEAVDAYAAGKRDFSITDSTPLAPTGPDGPLPPEAIAALSRGQVIAAIKIVRQADGSGLKEAKDRVDAYRADPGSQDIAAAKADRQGPGTRDGARRSNAAPSQRMPTVVAGDRRSSGWWLAVLLALMAGAYFWLG